MCVNSECGRRINKRMGEVNKESRGVFLMLLRRFLKIIHASFSILHREIRGISHISFTNILPQFILKNKNDVIVVC
jgi:hypothetical protein